MFHLSYSYLFSFPYFLFVYFTDPVQFWIKWVFSRPYICEIAAARALFRLKWILCAKYIIGEGNGNPLQYSCLENPRDRGAWWAAVCGVTQSRTWLKWLSSSSNTESPHDLKKARVYVCVCVYVCMYVYKRTRKKWEHILIYPVFLPGL